MAAPSGIVWGSTVGSYGRIGIYRSVTTTNTKISGTIEIWFWSKYSVSDTANTLYFSNLNSSGSATKNWGSVNISTSVDSGSGWSTSNQKKILSTTYEYTRGTSASTRYLYAKLTDVNRVGGTMYASTTFSVPKLDSYYIYYNANGGSGAPPTQTKYYDKTLTLSSTKPTRTGYTFVGWGTSYEDASVNFNPGDNYTTNAGDTLYAIWKKTITLSYNANGGSNAPTSQSATVYNATTSYKFTLSSAKPTRTGYTFKGWSKSSTATEHDYTAGGSITLSSSDTLYAVWKINTYTVSYNPNGGSNAPPSQTKTYGKTLTLSSSKPTRTGYTFLGWATSASATTAAYSAGGSYTANSATTLYAVWKIITYTVSYNANGGSGAPGSDTKIYGETLTLSGVIPNRTNYDFKGWATSASATSSLYSAGGLYKTNSAVTLYAVWELAYKKPSITGFSIERCDSNGSITDDGTNAYVKFSWSTTLYDVKEIKIDFTSGSETISRTLSSTGQNGDVNWHIKDIELSADITYGVVLTVSDEYEDGNPSYKTTTIPGTKFIIDLLANGDGISFGKSADKSGYADFNFATYHRKTARFAPNIGIYGTKPDGREFEVINPMNTNGNTVIGWDNYDQKDGNTNIYGYDVMFGISSVSDPVVYYPYYKPGDTISNFTFRTAGYVTNSGKDVYFWIPISKPIIGCASTITAVSINGFMFRQNDKYTHGSSASVYVKAKTLTAHRTTNSGIAIVATFDDITNVVNNNTIGVYWNGSITFI